MKRAAYGLIAGALVAGCTPAAVWTAGALRDKGPNKEEAALIKSETAPYQIRGRSSIKGRAYVVRADGQTVPCANRDVYLTPATTYAKSRVPRVLESNEIPRGDARGAQLWRTGRTDAAGGFSFSQLASGEYFVLCQVPLSMGGKSAGMVAAARVQVGEAQTVTVEVRRTVP